MKNKYLKNILTAAFLLVFGASFGATVYGQSQLAGTWKQEKDAGMNIKRFEMQINDEGLIIYSNLRWKYPFIGDYECSNPVSLLYKPISNGAVYDTGCPGFDNIYFTIEKNKIAAEFKYHGGGTVDEKFNLERTGTFDKQREKEAQKALKDVEEANKKAEEKANKAEEIRLSQKLDFGRWIGTSGDDSFEMELDEKGKIVSIRLTVKQNGDTRNCSSKALFGKNADHKVWGFLNCGSPDTWIEFIRADGKVSANFGGAYSATLNLRRATQSDEKQDDKPDEKSDEKSDETDKTSDEKPDANPTKSVFEGSWSGSANANISDDGKESESELNISDLTIKNLNDVTYAFNLKIGENTVQCSSGAKSVEGSFADVNTLNFSFTCGNLAFDAELNRTENGLKLEVEGKENAKNLTVEKTTISLSRKK